MIGRKLKHYETYLNKLKAYAVAMHIMIERKTEPSDGVYIPSRRVIRIDPDLDESTEIATLLHEFGHALEDYIIDNHSDPRLSEAYSKIYTDHYNKKDKELVIEREIAAWHIGRKIAKILRIKLGKWYDNEEQDALKDYRSK